MIPPFIYTVYEEVRNTLRVPSEGIIRDVLDIFAIMDSEGCFGPIDTLYELPKTEIRNTDAIFDEIMM